MRQIFYCSAAAAGALFGFFSGDEFVQFVIE
jgi:hypothetical protein